MKNLYKGFGVSGVIIAIIFSLVAGAGREPNILGLLILIVAISGCGVAMYIFVNRSPNTMMRIMMSNMKKQNIC